MSDFADGRTRVPGCGVSRLIGSIFSGHIQVVPAFPDSVVGNGFHIVQKMFGVVYVAIDGYEAVVMHIDIRIVSCMIRNGILQSC